MPNPGTAKPSWCNVCRDFTAREANNSCAVCNRRMAAELAAAKIGAAAR